MESLYQKLKNCASREDVRATAVAELGLSFPVKQSLDCTERVAFTFVRFQKLSGEKAYEALAQAAYALRELKLGDTAMPVPPFVCVIGRGEALLAESGVLSAFFARRGDGFDWDRKPTSPCPLLVEAIKKGVKESAFECYDLKKTARERAFLDKLYRWSAVQISMFSSEKKTIDEENFLKVYERWAELFLESVSEGGNGKRAPEFFLADIEDGKTRYKGGRVEFTLGDGRVTKTIPAYEYEYFWSLYERVKDEGVIFAIRRKIDRLSEDFARRFEGEFYTPVTFASKAYEYIQKTIGKKQLESGAYRIWDMAAGSGNLEFTLPAAALPYAYISTLDAGDAAYCKRIFPASTVFQYDYLNDDVLEKFGEGTGGALKLPQKLVEDLANPKLKWLIFINPPFATSNKASTVAGKSSKAGVSDTAIRQVMLSRGFGETGRELFSQFLFRISEEFKGRKAYLGLFSTVKYLNAPNDKKLREQFFRYKAERGFVFSSENFEGSKGKFPVAFAVWNMGEERSIESQRLTFDVFDNNARKVGVKRIYTADRGAPLSSWVVRPPTKYVFPPFTGATNVCEKNVDVRDRVAEGFLCSLMCAGNDLQHQNQTALFSGPQASAGSYSVTAENFARSMAVHAVRRLPVPTWSNNRDQYYAPCVEPSEDFLTNCAVWSTFSDSNNTCSLENVAYKGQTYRVRNQLFPFPVDEVKTWGETRVLDEGEPFLASWLATREISAEAARVLNAARTFYRWCFSHGLAERYDVGFAQLKSALARGGEEYDGGRVALKELKEANAVLGKVILTKAYAYGFIPADVEYFAEE